MGKGGRDVRTRPQAKELQEPWEPHAAGGTLPRAFRRKAGLPTPGFRTSGLQAVKEHVSVGSNPAARGHL